MSKISEGLKLVGEGFIELAQLTESITPTLPAMVAAPPPAPTEVPAEAPVEAPVEAPAEVPAEVPTPAKKKKAAAPQTSSREDVDPDLAGMTIAELRGEAKETGLALIAQGKRDAVVSLLKTFGAPNAAGVDDSRFAEYVTALRRLR